MRLSDEKSLLEQVTVEQFRQNLVLLKAEEIEIPKKWVLELLNTIEALQQENEQLKDENASIRNWNACEEKLHNELLESDKRRIELESELEDEENYRAGLEAIVEQLKAQVARMRDVLELIVWKEKDTGWAPMAKYALATDTAQDYHNPADVAALQKAREALDLIKLKTVSYGSPYIQEAAKELCQACRKTICDKCDFIEALAEIDKVLGGGQDV